MNLLKVGTVVLICRVDDEDKERFIEVNQKAIIAEVAEDHYRIDWLCLENDASDSYFVYHDQVKPFVEG